MIISSREMKHFHSENRTHFTEKVQKGTELEIKNAACAPMDIKILGASYQKVTVQGKNLFNKERYIIKDSVIGFDLSLLETGKKYTFSISVPCYWFKISDGPSGYNSVQYYSGGNNNTPMTKLTFTMARHGSISESAKQYLWLSIMGRGSVSFENDISVFEGVNIQIEEGSTATDFEAFVPDSPSEAYPSEIFPLENVTVKCANGDNANEVSIPFVGYSISGVCDSLEYDSKTKTARLVSYIDEEKLDFTKPLSEQSEAVREVSVETVVYAADGYDFSSFKTLQGDSLLSASGTVGEEAVSGELEVAVKVIKGGVEKCK